MLLEALVALIVAGVTYWVFTLHFKHRRYNHIPGPPRDSFFFGNLGRFKRRVKDDGKFGPYFTDLYHEYGEIFVIWMMTTPALIICDPVMIKEILTDNKHFKKPETPTSMANIEYIGGQRMCGAHSVLTDYGGPIWEHKKRIMDPAFSLQKLTNHLPKMFIVALRMADSFERIQAEKGKVDLTEAIAPFTIDAISMAGFSATEEELKRLNSGLKGIPSLFVAFFKANLLQTMFPRFSGLHALAEKAGKEIYSVRETGKQLIINRTSGGKFGAVNDILDHVIAANHNKETGELDLEGSLDDFMAMYAAGNGTTLTTMCWVTAELVRNPDVMEKLVEEVDRIWVTAAIDENSDSDTIANTLRDMKYLEAVVKESLRHHPPVTLTVRMVAKAARISGYEIPAGTRLMASQETMHHLPKYWDKPEEFNPNRFIDSSPVPFTYYPFFMGPRRCMGKNFAILELKTLLCVTLARFTMTKDPSTPDKIRSVQALLCKSEDNIVRLTSR